MFGLKAKHIDAINACFAQYPQIEQVILYGSRAKGNYKNGSDIDLTIVGDLDYNSLLKLENQLDDLLLPYKMDLSLKHKITNPNLLDHIKRVGKVFYEKEKQLAVHEPQTEYEAKPSEWKTYKLGEVYDFASGLSKGKDFFGTGYDFVTFKDVFQNYFLPEQLTALVETNEKERESCSVKKGDVFLTRTSENDAELGLSSVALRDYPNATFNGFTKRLRPKENIEIVPEFAGFYFRSPKFRARLSQFATMTTRASLNNEILSNLTIDLPSKEIQVQIGRILKSLDDKIALNLQMNQTLEAMAQAIFKEWFVNFNFPGFDGELVNGLPKGWEIGKIGEYITVTDYVANGSFASLKENVTLYDENEFALYVRTTDNNSGFSGSLKYVDESSYQFLKKSTLYGNEVIISNVGDVGTVFRPPIWLNQPMTLGSNAIMIKEHFLNDYLFFKLSSKEGQHSISGLISGSAQPKFNKTAFRNMEIVIPANDIVYEFNNLYQPIKEKLNQNKGQIETLKNTRDTLLPKLMSGQLQVSEL